MRPAREAGVPAQRSSTDHDPHRQVEVARSGRRLREVMLLTVLGLLVIALVVAGMWFFAR